MEQKQPTTTLGSVWGGREPPEQEKSGAEAVPVCIPKTARRAFQQGSIFLVKILGGPAEAARSRGCTPESTAVVCGRDLESARP
jgi:hypothetical protein